jgi:capsular polysaccharide biosynthesis protein
MAFGLAPIASESIALLHAGPMSRLEQFLLDRLRPANVKVLRLESRGLLQIDEARLVSFPAWRFSGWLPHWCVAQIRAALLPDRESRRDRRIYISRRGRRKVLNEDALVVRLSRHGFEVVDPESLPFAEQVELFYDAEIVVGTHGAGLTNLLFADRARVIEIFPTSRVFPHYALLAASLGLSYRYVLGSHASRGRNHSVDEQAVEALLMEGTGS